LFDLKVFVFSLNNLDNHAAKQCLYYFTVEIYMHGFSCTLTYHKCFACSRDYAALLKVCQQAEEVNYAAA